MPSTALALTLSAFAAFVVTSKAMPPRTVTAQPSPDVVEVQGESSRTYRERQRVERPRRVYEDCHRDVRTHRIGREMVTHRHVGDDCRIRIVRQSSQPLPGD